MNGNRVTLRVKGLTLMGLRRGETVNVIVPVIVVGADHVSALFCGSECRNWASLSEEFRPQISQIIRILICVDLCNL